MTEDKHIPVMLREMLEDLAPSDGGKYVDGTFGSGGYSRAILDAADTTVWSIDRDPHAIEDAQNLSRQYGQRLNLIQGRFSEMKTLLRVGGVKYVNGVVLDLGLSSCQISGKSRGFSFRLDAPLDMRMGMRGPTAAHVVNTSAEKELVHIIRRLGEERRARQVARAIVYARSQRPITRTRELAEIIRRVVPQNRSKIDPATRTFMALRIHINDELTELSAVLRAAELILAPGGRLVVVSFHSLEDRMVKMFLRERGGNSSSTSRHLPPLNVSCPPSFKLLRRSVLKPSLIEINRNPLARSARLRAAERTEDPPWRAEKAA